MHSVKDIATYFLALSDPKVGDLISNLKLQKLCYYAQGFHLAIHGTKLFPEKIEAWTHGPVVRELYQAYKKHGDGAIPLPEKFDISIYGKNTQELLNEVYSVYGQYSAWKLRNMTHEEPPWMDAKKSGKAISNSAMKEYFKTLIA
ncbi:MAG: DUF4065 domain-containing protein [Nitrospira sp.]|nr:MAG: DUF4065 domain-containing protein [Nitrospira sp.]